MVRASRVGGIGNSGCLLIPVVVAGIFVGPSGCDGRSSPKPGPTAATAASEARHPTYTTRAVIEGLPSADGKRFLSMHHEAIPDFADKSGKVVGMKEMVMPFPGLAPGVSLEGFAVGDAVEVTFEVRWNEVPRTVVTSIRKLAEGEKPTFGGG